MSSCDLALQSLFPLGQLMVIWKSWLDSSGFVQSDEKDWIKAKWHTRFFPGQHRAVTFHTMWETSWEIRSFRPRMQRLPLHSYK